MTSEMLVSVVIPTFGRPGPLRRALASVAIQDVSSLEVIVVDDCSHDEHAVREAAASVAGLKVQVVRHSINKGGAAARNTGVANATGRYIAFLDSDDEWLPDKLSNQLETARQQTDERWLSYCRSFMKTSERHESVASIWPKRALAPSESVGDYLFVAGGFMPTPSFFMPRSLAQAVPFNESLRRHQDYDFLLKLEAAGCRFLMIEKPLVVVHWEDLNSSLRGFSPQGSLAFLQDYGHLMSPQARSGFVVQQIVLRALRAGFRWEGLRTLFRHVRLRDISPANWSNIGSLFLFKDTRITRALVGLKRRLRRG